MLTYLNGKLSVISGRSSLKIWSIEDWKDSGGYFPGNYGVVIRTLGYSEPGYFVGDSYFLAIVHTGEAESPNRMLSGSMVNQEQNVTWLPYVRNSDLDIKQTIISEGLSYYKYGKVVIVTVDKEITLVSGWTTITTDLPKTNGRYFNVCFSSNLNNKGFLFVGNTNTILQVEFDTLPAGTIVNVRGSIVYIAES